MTRGTLDFHDDYLERFPRTCAHIIAESFGWVTPRGAGSILKDMKEGEDCWCEWIYYCYDNDPRLAVRDAIRGRHHHADYMSDYRHALRIVRHKLKTGEDPLIIRRF